MICRYGEVLSNRVAAAEFSKIAVWMTPGSMMATRIPKAATSWASASLAADSACFDAEVIFEAVTTDRPRLRYLVGADAEGLAAGRARMSDEEWVAMGGELTDEEYNARFKRHFGIELR